MGPGGWPEASPRLLWARAGWGLRGAGLKSQDSWEGTGELSWPPRIWGGREGTAPSCVGCRGPANPWSTSSPWTAGGWHLKPSREGLGQTGARGPSNGASRPRLTFKNSECVYVCLGFPGVLALVCVCVCVCLGSPGVLALVCVSVLGPWGCWHLSLQGCPGRWVGRHSPRDRARGSPFS